MEPLLKLIKEFEGCHKKKADGLIYPYLCPAGYPTQGWGIRVDSMKVPPITQEEADKRLMEVVPSYIEDALGVCPNLKEYPMKLYAVADFVYNLGKGNFSKSTLAKKIKAEDWQGAAGEFGKWVNGRVNGKLTKLPGLVRRREAEKELFLSDGIL